MKKKPIDLTPNQQKQAIMSMKLGYLAHYYHKPYQNDWYEAQCKAMDKKWEIRLEREK